MIFLIAAIIILLPIAWLLAEFHGSLPSRITLGALSILVLAICAWVLSDVLNGFQYNAWYGGATGELIDTSVEEIEDGNADRVLKVWRSLDRQYQPTYENRANYDELVEDATQRIRGEIPIDSGGAWDASQFTYETWVGHWGTDDGYWIVINTLGGELDVLQSGQPRDKVHSVSLSSDFTVLEFKEGDSWLHRLTLRNKYEATYEWFNLENGTIWESQSIFKLIRASEDQKRSTQRTKASSKAESSKTPENH